MKSKFSKFLTLFFCLVMGMNVWGETETLEWSQDGHKTTLEVEAKKGTSAVSTYSSYKIQMTGDSHEYTSAIKMESSTTISFSTTGTASVTIGYCAKYGSSYSKKGNIKFDGTANSEILNFSTSVSSGSVLNETKGVIVTTFSDIEAGTHTISRGDSELGVFYVKVVQEKSTEPQFSVNKASISFEWFPFMTEALEETIVAKGKNLTPDATGTIALENNVDGLTFSPSTFTVDENGEVSETITVSYQPTVNVDKSSVTLNFSVSGKSASTAISYKAKVDPFEMEAISSLTTFALNQTGELSAVVTSDDYVLISNAGSTASFANNLAVKGVGTLNVTWRSDAIQAGYFKFMTNVDGFVTVKFSDVGSSTGRAARYANVNGTRSSQSSNSSNTTVTTSPIKVEAGEIIIKGEIAGDGGTFSDNQIRVYSIEFTPSYTLHVTDAGWGTLCLPFATVPAANTTLYTGTLSGTTLSLTAQTEIPANTPLLVEAAEGDYTFTAADGSAFAAIENNALYGVMVATPYTTIATTTEKTPLALGLDANNVVGFRQPKNTVLPANRACLLYEGTPSAPIRIVVGEQVATDIESVNAETVAQKVMINGQVFILRGEKLFDTVGRQVK